MLKAENTKPENTTGGDDSDFQIPDDFMERIIYFFKTLFTAIFNFLNIGKAE